jgi:hypothetical protein
MPVTATNELLTYLTEEAIYLEEALVAEATEKIYVIITDTKTAFSSVASVITGQNYNHVSIGFDRDLKEMFSFDMKSNTIVKETPELFDKAAKFIMYSIAVTKEAKDRILARIRYIFEHKSSFVYSKLTLLRVTMNRLFNTKVFSNDEDSEKEYICSTFVSEIFSFANVNLFKRGFIPSPDDYKRNRFLKYEFRGSLRNFIGK